MKKFLKKTSILLIGVLAVSVLLMSCSQVNDIKNGVKKGAEDVTSGIKEGAKDVKKGVEDITKSKAPLVGTWKGMQPNGEGYRVTLYEDSTYETLKYDKDNNEKAVYSGKYTIDGDKITMNREKEKKNNKIVDSKEVDNSTYVLENGNKLTIKNASNFEMMLNKESNIADKIIK